jgi:hypothetical protein
VVLVVVEQVVSRMALQEKLLIQRMALHIQERPVNLLEALVMAAALAAAAAVTMAANKMDYM